jgi:hypothetical protein
MLAGQIAGLNDSWAIRWHAAAFLKEKLTLYPGRSLAINIGNDQSGSNCSAKMDTAPEFSTQRVNVMPQPIEEDNTALTAYAAFLRRTVPRHCSIINLIRRLWHTVSRS